MLISQQCRRIVVVPFIIDREGLAALCEQGWFSNGHMRDAAGMATVWVCDLPNAGATV